MGKMVGAGAEIFDKLEPEPEPKFLTSWSRSRTKMDRLRNTAHQGRRRQFFTCKGDCCRRMGQHRRRINFHCRKSVHQSFISLSYRYWRQRQTTACTGPPPLVQGAVTPPRPQIDEKCRRRFLWRARLLGIHLFLSRRHRN
jgi:hypothetical protein